MSKLKEEFGKEDGIEEIRGDLYDYLGFTIDYSLPGKVISTMHDYLEDIIVKVPEDLKNRRNGQYPANERLFKLDPLSPLIPKVKSNLFH